MIIIFKLMPDEPSQEWKNVQDKITLQDVEKAAAVATRRDDVRLPKMMTDTMAATLLLGQN